LSIIFSIALVFMCQVVSAQNILGLINKSNQFFEHLDKGEFETAHSFFDESVKGKILPEELKLFWTRMDLMLGTFESVDGAQNRAAGEFYLVTLNCKFSKGSQAFQFTFNKAEKLVGFFVVPNSNAAEYRNPSYADSTLLVEKPIMLKSPGHELAGMVVTPKNAQKFPVVVLVHGSGPNDMDETIGPNKPFKDLAFGLAAKGIATLRYVKRTKVYPYEFQKAFTIKEEVTEDALAAIAFAKSIPGADPAQIYVLGHSLGGMMAPRLAALTDVKGVILAAAPAKKLTDVLIEQSQAAFKALNDTTRATRESFELGMKELERTRITRLGNMKPDSLLWTLPASYWQDLNQYDQVATAKSLKGRILVIQGEMDFQVDARHAESWKGALSSKKNATVKVYPKLNHLLMEVAEKGTVAQYREPRNVAPYLIDDLAAWIRQK
ncbi:MAG TPA: alpha/beta fold hydrolase, partial [Sphingobacteriaceae bacterium]